MFWRSIPDRIAGQARINPGAPALVWHGEEVSFARLCGMAGGAAAHIAGLGLPPDEPVAMASKKSPQAVAVVLACLMLRRPVLLPSPELGERAMAALVDRCGARMLPPPGELVGEEGEFRPDPQAAAQDVALLLSTSGSTGAPKVVPLTAGGVVRFTDWAADHFGIGPGTTVLNYAPLHFDLCLLDIWTTLGRGGCAVLVDQDMAANPAHLLALLQARPVQMLHGVPLLYQLLVQAARSEQTSEAAFAAVEHAVLTGDAITAKAFTPLPALLPKARFHNVYGCTETNDSFIHLIDADDPMPHGAVPIGEPIDGVASLLLTEDGHELRGPGVAELLVNTPFQTPGYLDGDPGHEAFTRRGPVRYYRTGDLVRRHPDGQLTLEGRRDFMAKVRGVRVNTAEVEAALRSHPDVVEAAVLALPDEVAGARLHAVVQHAPGARTLNSLTLRQHIAALLPRAAIPTGFALVDTALPRTSTGKLDRKAVLFGPPCARPGDSTTTTAGD